MTHGDTTKGVKCPVCKRTRWFENAKVQQGEIVEFVAACPGCGEPIRYWLRWMVTVDAEKDSKCK